MRYTNKHFFYTDPAAYDERVRQPIESFIANEWDPLLRQYLHDEIRAGMTVADLGCGTFIHTQHMGAARHIYAVDINEKMLAWGRPKIEHMADKVTILCESATHTSLPAASCDVVWVDGLSEFLHLPDLFREVQRIIKPGGKFIILYQNKWHPENLLVALYYWLLRRRGKKYRSLGEFKKTAARFNFNLLHFESRALFFYAPPFLQNRAIGLWRRLNRLYAPYQKKVPLGNNILCIFQKG